MIQGIDVSYWQGQPDFTKVVADGKVFCGIKLTDGHTVETSTDHAQSVAAKKAGLKIFFYHFGHPEQCDPSVNGSHTATDEANFFISVIRKNSIPTADMIPALDIEQVYNTHKQEVKIPASVSLEAWIQEFCAAMAQGGFPKVLLYSNPTYLNEYLSANHSLGDMPLWLSEYSSKITLFANGFPKTPAMWQYSGSGTVSGIAGQVDLNVCPDLAPLLLDAPSA
jgi:GH25 family lysozyme M1 (1,4-beta-N-acetylmuramidase)